MSRLLAWIFIISLASTMCGCGWQSSAKPSVLIIAVEGLQSDSIGCTKTSSDEGEERGLSLCRESVRFTHAFTPSTMSQAALTSVLTGLYPYDHGVRHNGSQFLDEKFLTLPEVAIKNDMRTYLVSGGAPILRKSGLAQGFEIFEDGIPVNFRRIFKPAQHCLNQLIRWISQESDESVFAVAYLSDLLFPTTATKTNNDEDRPAGFDGQIQEVLESINNLTHDLKAMGKWDNTHVILIGLNGVTERFKDETIAPLNLHNENTQIAFLWKPAQRSRDEGVEWTIDANVSLVDVGVTLFELISSGRDKVERSRFLNGVSLVSTLQKPFVDWDKDRFIVTESAWPQWRQEGENRFSVRKNNHLYFFDQRPALYNTLIDRFEVQPLVVGDPIAQNLVREFNNFFSARKIDSWTSLSDFLLEKLKYFRDEATSPQDIKREAKFSNILNQRPWDAQIVGWLAKRLIKEQIWSDLLHLAKKEKNQFWSYVAMRNLGIEMDPPVDVCWKLLKSKNPSVSKEWIDCGDHEWKQYVSYVVADKDEKSAQEEKLFNIYARLELEEKISAINYQLGLIWDTALDIPGSPRLFELALELPENKKLKRTFANKIAKLQAD